MGNPKSRFDFRWKLTQEAGEDQEAEIEAKRIVTEQEGRRWR